MEEKVTLQTSSDIMLYGADLQKKVAELSQLILHGLEEDDSTETADSIRYAAQCLNELEEEEKKGNTLLGKFTLKRALENKKNEALKSVEKLEKDLEEQRIRMLMKNAEIEQLLRLSREYSEKVKTHIEKADATGLERELKDLLSHRKEELTVTLTVSRQQEEQIKLLQKNVSFMMDTLQATLFHVIPMWKKNYVDRINQQQPVNKLLTEHLEKIVSKRG